MANLWRFKQNLHVDQNVKWPALLSAQFELTPSDFYRRDAGEPIRTTVCGDTQIEYDEIKGRVVMTKSDPIPALDCRFNFSNGFLKISGNIAQLEVTVENLGMATLWVDWISRIFSEFLTIQIGTYCESYNWTGTIDGIPFKIAYPAGAFGISIVKGDDATRVEQINNAFQLVDLNSPSYPRFVACSSYFNHALRLMSPYQVYFPQDVALPEVILNLAKCIELLFPSSNREGLKKRLLLLDYTKEQIDSQLISIIILRNEIDVGHPTSGLISHDEITSLRQFSQRAIDNVRHMLKRTAQKISENSQLLAPISSSSTSDRNKLITRLTKHLESPSLRDVD